MPLGHHVTFRLVDSRVIAPTTTDQRRMAKAVLLALRPYALLAFRCADTHGHLELLGSAADAREAAHRALIATSKTLALPVRFQPAHLEAIHDQAHLDRAFRHVLRQDEHHGFAHDPWLDASNAPDLLGLRSVGTWTATTVRRALPRIDRAALLDATGLTGLDEQQPDATDLADAAAAAIAAPKLTGRSAPVVAARCAAVHVGRSMRSTADVAALLDISPRAVCKLAARTPDDALVQAVTGQLRLRALRSPAGT